MSSQVKFWLIEKYAKHVPATNQDNLLINSKCHDKSEAGEWKYFCTGGKIPQIKIALLPPLNLLITSGDSLALESFSLHGNTTDSWIKAICQEDCMLFCYKIKDESRRFRIQFAANALSTSQESCSDFVKNISKYIYVKTIDSDADNASQASQSMLVDQSQTQLGSSMEYEYSIPIKNEKPPNKITDAQIFATKSVRQIASAVVKNSSENLPVCYQSTNTNSASNLDSLVKSCLLDPNFPAFVGQVEQSLKTLISN